MAKQAVAATSKPNLFVRIKEFIQEVKIEMQKVAWPTREEVKASTWIVSVLLLLLGGVMFVFDFVFQQAIIFFLKLG